MSEEAIARVEAYVAGDDLWTIYNDTFGRNLDKHYADLRALLSLARQGLALEEALGKVCASVDRYADGYGDFTDVETSAHFARAALQSRSR